MGRLDRPIHLLAARAESCRRADARRMGGRVKPGHDDFFETPRPLRLRVRLEFADVRFGFADRWKQVVQGPDQRV